MVKRMRNRVQSSESTVTNQAETLVVKDSPDDFSYEGAVDSSNPGTIGASAETAASPWLVDENDTAVIASADSEESSEGTQARSHNDAYVTMDSPDDV